MSCILKDNRSLQAIGRCAGSVIACVLMLQGCVMVSSHPLKTSNHLTGASAIYALPKTLVTAKRDKAGGDVTISEVAIADPDHMYALSYEKNPFSDDDLTVEVDASTGLIKSVNATASDKTADVFETLGETAGRIAGLQASGGIKGFLSASTDMPFEVTFDPSDTKDMQNAASVISAKSSGAEIKIRCLQCPTEMTKALEGTVDGILVRPARFVRIDICKGACSNGQFVASQWLKSYSGSPIVSIPVERAVAVTRQTTLTFAGGAVSKIIHDKPSEAAGVAAIPGKIISSIFAGFTQAETDKQGIIDASTSSMEAQTKLIEAQTKLIEAETALEKLHKQNATSSDGAGGSAGGGAGGGGGSVVPPTGDNLFIK